MKKNILIIGGVFIIVGLLLFIFGFRLFGILSGGIGILVLISSALIGASKAETEGQEFEIESQLRKSISKARQDKFRSEANINKLTQWAQDTVMNTFTSDLFPEGQPFTRNQVLEKWSEISEKYAEKVSFEVLDKCNDVVKGYLNQIDLEKSKIKVFDKLQTEYEELKEKIRITKQNSKKSQRIDKQGKKLQSMQDDTTGIAHAIELEYNMEDLTKEVEVKQEYFKQLEQLQYQYGDDVNSTEAVDFKQKIDEMLKNLE
jgi:hypothetical protein